MHQLLRISGTYFWDSDPRFIGQTLQSNCQNWMLGRYISNSYMTHFTFTVVRICHLSRCKVDPSKIAVGRGNCVQKKIDGGHETRVFLSMPYGFKYLQKGSMTGVWWRFGGEAPYLRQWAWIHRDGTYPKLSFTIPLSVWMEHEWPSYPRHHPG